MKHIRHAALSMGAILLAISGASAAQPWPQRPEGVVLMSRDWLGTPPYQTWRFEGPGLPKRLVWRQAWEDSMPDGEVDRLEDLRIEDCNGTDIRLPLWALRRMEGDVLHVWLETRRTAGPCRLDRLRLSIWVLADLPEPDPQFPKFEQIGRIWQVSFTHSGRVRVRLEREVSYDETLIFRFPERAVSR
jgi:hypothetical protein